ncbi:Polyprenol-phosphate-mannose-dependent alpha-(1-2)-phosphatidylinositol mannoside mannosyltransferase [Nocardia sp. RB56]|uniref:Polyprenol-phosphate-mannose-dependent alpha-(1-2)-phosphatidylinositol mannoside mannosyltransferase n=2 Tax=Nocardia aurantia TaxID=2585199 RepID=A0A7K0DSE4_9NOCA|nr:Polyprenol-phosphate-mannose-dependent alpha-(1-2)-phosphatidylinositol mannoside mannosyltransferase [Nocardia aurantia]
MPLPVTSSWMVSVTTSSRPTAATRRFPRIVWALPALLAAICVWWLLHPSGPLTPIKREYIDLQVYRLGVQAMWHGADMYGSLPKTTMGISLPFIYPPFAALALSPFAMLPWHAAATAFFVVTVLALAVTLYLAARRIWSGGVELALLVTACALPLALLLEPIHSTLDFGQVNLLLMVLVAIDCLAGGASAEDPSARSKWPRGVLVGLAAAIKLTPAAFVLYFLVRRDYRAAATAAITGAVATALAYAVLPRESTRYWFGGMGNVSGLSGSAFRTNQSIQGVLSRFQVPRPEFTALWLLLSLVLLALVVPAMRRAADNPPLVLAFNAVFTLLASPISWSHHWVWIAPALLAGVGAASRAPLRQALVWYAIMLATAVVFVIGPQNWEPGEENRELSWTPWQHFIGDTYVWLSVVLLVLYLVTTGTRKPAAVPA